jgi:hypothetical protein
LADSGDIEDGCVFRVAKSYPVYDSDYRSHLSVLRDFVDRFENFQTIGRNGLHRYNNQDHAMLTGMQAVSNLLEGKTYDLWNVNAEQEYHEHIEERIAPVDESDRAVEEAFAVTFSKVDRVALGVSAGVTCGALLMLATLFLVLKGGEVVGPHLSLLSQYFPGYSVTLMGSFVGAVYAFLTGFIAGWFYAFFRNTTMLVYFALARRSAERQLIQKLLHYL